MNSDRSTLWPKAGGVLALIICAVYYFFRDWFFASDHWMFWVHIPVLMIHQFEEYVFPGGFKPWFNRTIFHQDDDDFPLSWPLSLRVNVPGWLILIVAATVSTLWSDYLLIIGFIPLLGSFHNAWFHITETVKGNYSPGTITSVLLYIPLTAYALYRFYSTGQITWWEMAIAFFVGMYLHHRVFQTMQNIVSKSKNEKVAA